MRENVCCIILAAGLGTRFGERKQFVVFRGKEVWRHSFDKASKLFPRENIVVVGVDIPGGDTRSKSVFEGLRHFKNMPGASFGRVVILEAARPLVTTKQIQEAADDTAASTTYVLPVINTVILRDGTYLERSDCFYTVSPQAYDFEKLYEAYASGKWTDVTDDGRVMKEAYGIKPHCLMGGENLIKITYRSDMAELERLADLKKWE